ncbi:hypothetical protein DFH08DRAFT_803416 [Mycena albidolilacea]|uniref:Uncharacterized protein n=1 Tax=Mycena albidolilacea TaxID=1033008 RepID=A0AAD7AD84_9AGAR|nr:hypothetical protein DFH08DRAFT_803416 [Mycena albidolilacea]
MSRPPPLLLDNLDFPLPPTHIPPSPHVPPSPAAHFNPPPSLPPTAPLPPVPGPSRIADTDTLLLLSSGPPRSRSKLSLNRDSIASTRSSVSTRSSLQTPSSAAQSLHRPSLTFSIDEDAESSDDLLEGISKAPLDDPSEDASVPVPPIPASRRTPPRTTTPRRESISLTSVAIPAPDNDSDIEPDFDALDTRAESPDIATILATTPRPRLTPHAIQEEPWEEDFINDYGQVRSSSRSSADFTFGYPPPDAQSVNSDDEQSNDLADPDCDSDIDLHTSLPQLMLHHGFLSPQSKLLPQSLVPSPAPSPAASLFPSTEPPSRDTRDTPGRRVRHRDGKTLRGGIGLTTGLGWSDSEDEDAPSALTRRISSLDLHQSGGRLSRASSLSLSTRASTSLRSRVSTLASTRQSSFSSASTSRSTSRARRTQSEHEADMSVDEFGVWDQPTYAASRSKAPPTSWARRSDPTSRLSRAQSYSTLGRIPSVRTDDSTHSARTTTSAETARSTSSLPLVRTRSRVMRDDTKPLPRTPSLHRNTSITGTPSTQTRSLIRPRATTGLSGVSGLPHLQSRVPLSMQSTPLSGLPSSSDAHVPPALPSPALRPLRLQPRNPVLGGDRAPVPVPPVLNSVGIPASGTAASLSSSVSSEYTVLSASTSASSLLTPSSSVNSHGSLLSSPQTFAPSSPHGSQFTRAPSPYAHDPSSPGFGMGPPSPGFGIKTPTTPMYEHGSLPRPRPRTGTGMVYRTSTYSPAVRASKIGIAL